MATIPLTVRLNRIVLTVLMVLMKHMDRVVPWLVRPMVRLVARREVIACGIRLPGEVDPVIIYTPAAQQHTGHQWRVRDQQRWLPREKGPGPQEWSGELVVYRTMPGATVNEVYQVQAEHMVSEKTLYSPRILIKPETVYDNGLLQVTLTEGVLALDWNAGVGAYEHMISFVTIAEVDGPAVFAAYTRETHLDYPLLQGATLYFSGAEAVLEAGKTYVIRLVIVDFEGWVPALSEQSFVYIAAENSVDGDNING